MQKVKAKKHLGQHFLNNQEIAEKIGASADGQKLDVLFEIGPGMGILTEILFQKWQEKLVVIEIDSESVAYLRKANWAGDLKIIEGDFLKLPLSEIFLNKNVGIIGNYPYNISTEIAFKVIENRSHIPWFGGMFQREVALRLCATHGNKDYGITSILLQAYFNCEYLFTVDENAFDPPPRVKSGVMRCVRKPVEPDVEYKNLSLVVKTAFNQRRKTLSNALRPLTSSRQKFIIPENWKGLRAEQLSVDDFIVLAKLWAGAV